MSYTLDNLNERWYYLVVYVGKMNERSFKMNGTYRSPAQFRHIHVEWNAKPPSRITPTDELYALVEQLAQHDIDTTVLVTMPTAEDADRGAKAAYNAYYQKFRVNGVDWRLKTESHPADPCSFYLTKVRARA